MSAAGLIRVFRPDRPYAHIPSSAKSTLLLSERNALVLHSQLADSLCIFNF